VQIGFLLDFGIKNCNQFRMMCRVCKSGGSTSGLLFRCEGEDCDAVHWDKSKILRNKKRILLKNSELRKEILQEAQVPDYIRTGKRHYCYLLRLKGTKKSVYVGMTGLHPYERYFNHIVGYKASSVAKKKVTALIAYEGPMLYDLAVSREKTWFNELVEKGYNAHGGK
jgi:predicted GIY-YIG superfamily endonuclease